MSDKRFISNSLTVGVIEDGTSPYFADLDNGMDSVSCDYQGVTASEQFVETNVCMFFGNQKQVIPISGGIVCKIGNTILGSSYRVSGVGYNYKVEVTNLGTTSAHIKLFVRDNTEIDSTTVTITVSVVGETGNESANLNFVINGVRAGKAGNDAVLYNLQPAQNEIVVSAKTDGTYTPSSFSLTCAYKKVVGGSVTTNNINGTIDSEYRVFFSRRRRNNKQWESDYYWYNSTTHATKIRRVNGVGGLDVITYDMVAFIFYKDNSSETISAASVSQANLVDKETVGVVSNGVAAPKYNDEFYAWNNVESTADAETSPFTEPYAGWSSSIPAQGSYAYLWKKIVPYSWNDTTLQYTAGTPQYFRMTGTEGTSINVVGNIKYAMSSSGSFPQPQASEYGNLAIKAGSNIIYRCSAPAQGVYAWIEYTTASNGNAYTVVSGSFTGSYQSTELAGHLVLWSQEAGDWVDLGKFKGENGTTYYTHIVWANNVTFSGGVVQTITGYLPVKPEGDTEHPWMGVHVDTNSADPIEGDNILKTYTWSNTKGDTGKAGESAASVIASPSSIVIECDSNGHPKTNYYKDVVFSLKVGTNSVTINSCSAGTLPSGFTVEWTNQNTARIGYTTSASASSMAAGIEFTLVSVPVGGKTYSAKTTIALIGNVQGEVGAIGRFFYYAGDWAADDNNKKFIINEAQVPYFSKAGDNHDHYYVFNYEADSYEANGYTMSDMWNSLTVKTGTPPAPSFNNAPWKVFQGEFNYVITNVLFANDFAKIGSFVFGGDWMLSQYGIIYDASGGEHIIDNYHWWTYNNVTYNADNAYTLFKAGYPNSSKPNDLNFAPYYCVDGLTGESYQQNAHVKGEIKATTGTIGGFNITPTQITSTNEKIILNNSDGSATLTNATITGAITATSGSLSNVRIGNADGNRLMLGTDTSSGKGGYIRGYNSSNRQLIEVGFSNNDGWITLDDPNGAGFINISNNSVIIESEIGTSGDYKRTEIKGDSVHLKYNKSNVLNHLTTNFDSNGKILVRAYDGNGASAWPTIGVTTAVADVTKGLVHVLTLNQLKQLFDTPSLNYNLYNKCAVLLVRQIT